MEPTPLQLVARDVLNRVATATSGQYQPPAHVGLRVATLLGDDSVDSVFVDLDPDVGERGARSGQLVVFGQRLLVAVELRAVPSRGLGMPGGKSGEVRATVLPRAALLSISLGPVPPWLDSANEVWAEHSAGWPNLVTLELTYEGTGAPVVLAPPASGFDEAFYASLTRDLVG